MFQKHILFYLQETMNDNKDDIKPYLQYNSVRSEGKPNLYEMSEVNIGPGTESRDDLLVNQTSDVSRDMGSSEAAKRFQHLDVQIKEEPIMNGTSGTSNCNEMEFIRHLLVSDYRDHTGKMNLDVHNNPRFIFRVDTDYAVCIKNEPESNSCEAIDPVASMNDANPSKAKSYHESLGKNSNSGCYYENDGKPDNGDNGHCYIDCKPASYDLQNHATQIKDGPMKCEIAEDLIHRNTLPCTDTINNSGSSVHNYHDHHHTFSISYEKLNSSDNKDSSTEGELTKHEVFKCDICSYTIIMPCHTETNYSGMRRYSTVKPNNLVTNQRKRTGEKPYKCDECSYSSDRRGDLVRHKKKHIGEKPYKCDVCNYCTFMSCDLVKHKRKHTGEKPYMCDVCNYCTTRSDQLADHQARHTEEKLHKCDLCSYGSVRFRDLVMHIKRKHTGEKLYKCDVCSYSTTSSGQLADHQERHKHEKGEKIYKCDVCTTGSSNLVRHKRKHTGEKSFKCDVCSYCAKESSNLVRHKRKHTGEKSFKCDVCSYCAKESSNLVRHKRKHTGEKSFKCDVCSYRTTGSSNLVRHKRKHTGEKSFKCDVCSYCAKESSNLVRHKRKHRERNRSSVMCVVIVLKNQVI